MVAAARGGDVGLSLDKQPTKSPCGLRGGALQDVWFTGWWGAMDPAAIKAQADKIKAGSRAGGETSSRSASGEDAHEQQHAPPPAPFHTSLPIPEHKTGWIIGKRGTYIKQLEKKSGAEITVSDSTSKEYGTTWKYIQISGSGREADRAKKLLHIRLDRLVPVGDGSKSDSYSDGSSDTASDAGDDSLFFPPVDAEEYPNVANFKRQKKGQVLADPQAAPEAAAAVATSTAAAAAVAASAPAHQLNADASVFAPMIATTAAAAETPGVAAPAPANAAPTTASAADAGQS